MYKLNSVIITAENISLLFNIHEEITMHVGFRGRKGQRGRRIGRERSDACGGETSYGSAGEILDLYLRRNVLLRQL